MEKEQILTKVQDVVMECLGPEREEVTMTVRFMEDLGSDSIMLAEIVMKLEDSFGLRISDEEAGGIRTVGDAVNFIESKLRIAA
ncbi:MAG TPA: acyl carrier protein [Bacteroidia bacterium]|jgi:acyl carrier protein|nr:acyl carrier protein [Bacteroidia bacterium]